MRCYVIVHDLILVLLSKVKEQVNKKIINIFGVCDTSSHPLPFILLSLSQDHSDRSEWGGNDM